MEQREREREREIGIVTPGKAGLGRTIPYAAVTLVVEETMRKPEENNSNHS